MNGTEINLSLREFYEVLENEEREGIGVDCGEAADDFAWMFGAYPSELLD